MGTYELGLSGFFSQQLGHDIRYEKGTLTIAATEPIGPAPGPPPGVDVPPDVWENYLRIVDDLFGPPPSHLFEDTVRFVPEPPQLVTGGDLVLEELFRLRQELLGEWVRGTQEGDSNDNAYASIQQRIDAILELLEANGEADGDSTEQVQENIRNAVQNLLRSAINRGAVTEEQVEAIIREAVRDVDPSIDIPLDLSDRSRNEGDQAQDEIERRRQQREEEMEQRQQQREQREQQEIEQFLQELSEKAKQVQQREQQQEQSQEQVQEEED